MPKTSQSKVIKKSTTKSRCKSNKVSTNKSSAGSGGRSGNVTTKTVNHTNNGSNNNSNNSGDVCSKNHATRNINQSFATEEGCVGTSVNTQYSYLTVNTTTSSTTSGFSGGSIFSIGNLNNNSSNNIKLENTNSSNFTGSGNYNSDTTSMPRNYQKNFAGLDPRSIRIMWEQHDESDVELSNEVCARVAEDVSYKLWELINNVKTYARHSGGYITYDLVNEVLKHSDVPPCLGALDTSWDRIDYDGSYFFYSDKIIELRDEYQREMSFELPQGADFHCLWPLEEKYLENLKEYVPNILFVTLNGSNEDMHEVLVEAAFSPLMGCIYRLLLNKIIQIVAFKQNNETSQRCWRLLRALSSNSQCRDVDCREEYFHLSEILICQLLAPYECIKTQSTADQILSSDRSIISIKMETDLYNDTPYQQSEHELSSTKSDTNNEKLYKLENDSDTDDNVITNNKENSLNCDLYDSINSMSNTSPYFASPVNWKLVTDLCHTLGHLAAISGYFQSESTSNIIRRLQRFFDSRQISSERDYNYISRAIRGLVSLGEYAFREFIPFIYKFNANDIPETVFNDFSLAAIYLRNADDIFLYEWLEFICGPDMLQPFMIYYAKYIEKFAMYNYCKRKSTTYKLIPKLGVRRLEWSTLVAAMCHGDDPNRALNPKPTLKEMFPKLNPPNLASNHTGRIRFRFAGCRPVNKYKQKSNSGTSAAIVTSSIKEQTNKAHAQLQHDILIAKRRLLKPLRNKKRLINFYDFYSVHL